MSSATAANQQSLPPIGDIVSALRERCPWGHLRLRLKSESLPVGMGWAELEANASTNSQSGQKLNSFLRSFHLEHLLTGERYVQFYDLSDSLTAAIDTVLQQAVIPQSLFSGMYPLPLTGNALSNAPSTPTLVDVRALQNGDWAILYSSIQSHNERTTSPITNLSATIQQIYSGYDELIAIKKVYYQAYDVVFVRRALERLEVCIDQPMKSTVDLDSRVHGVLAALKSNIPALVDVSTTFGSNIFGAISGIFFTPKEGTIKKLSFRTPTGSAKTERMVTSKDDLRKEKFHHAGMAAVDNKISPYELVVGYEFQFPKSDAEIRLAASIRDLSQDDPKLFGCYITSIDQPSFLQATNKVIKFT